MIDLDTFIDIFLKVLKDPHVIITTVAMLIVIDITYKIVNYRKKQSKKKKKIVIENKPEPKKSEPTEEYEEVDEEE